MALDREKILQAAQKHVDKKKFDKAIQEYQRIIQQDPKDARTLLKIGDLQARMEAYAEAIATYDRVGQFYSTQGFSLKAIAVYKQIRELIKKHVPQLEDRYGHIAPKLVQIYVELGLTSDALAALDEIATRLQRVGRDRDAIDVFRQMVSLDAANPLPHLRLAEACCRVQAVDPAIDSFWAAAELLLGLRRRDDALKVVERILHFKQDPKYARLAADLYLQRNGPQDGLQALAKLQICFQDDPKNLEILELLSRAFVAIGQASKALEVKKEVARLAQEQGRDDVFRRVLDELLQAAPNDEQVRALLSHPMSQRPPSYADDDAGLTASSHPPGPGVAEQAYSLAPEVTTEDIDFDDEPMSAGSLSEPPDAFIDEIEVIPSRRPFAASSSDVVVVDDQLEAAEEEFAPPGSTDARGHTRKALVDAESFRGLRLYGKAIETLRIAIEIDPEAVEVREKLRDILSDAGDTDGAIGEMVSLAAIYMERGEDHLAEAELYQVLEAVPGHATASEMLEQLGGVAIADAEGAAFTPYSDEHFDSTTAQVTDPGLVHEGYAHEAPPPSDDFDEIGARGTPDSGRGGMDSVDDPFGDGDAAPLPRFPLRAEEDIEDFLDEPEMEDFEPAIDPAKPSFPATAPLPSMAAEGIEEVLDEAEFFMSRGLTEDARGILLDALARSPGHPLLTDRLREIDGGDAARSGAHERSDLAGGEHQDDRIFDIAASLDALDELEQVTRSSRPPSSLRAVDEVDVDQVFAKFKEGVRAQVSDSDSATHYDLGVAYKEMGLHPDAINEFGIAGRDPKIECMCFSMIGMIHLELGDLDKAAEAYIRGLGAPQKNVDQEMSLYYDLGIVYEMKGSASEALYYFQKVARRDPGYRDVKDRIEALEPPSGQGHAASGGRQIQSDDELEAAFDDLFESK